MKIRSKEEQAIDVFKEFIKTRGNLTIDYDLETYMQIILDHINNLQQELQEANESITWWTNRFKAIQKENEKMAKRFRNCRKIKDNYKSRCEEANEYIENELFEGKDDLEWCRKNDGYISGSDLPADAILPLYDFLKGDSDEQRTITKSN